MASTLRLSKRLSWRSSFCSNVRGRIKRGQGTGRALNSCLSELYARKRTNLELLQVWCPQGRSQKDRRRVIETVPRQRERPQRRLAGTIAKRRQEQVLHLVVARLHFFYVELLGNLCIYGQ